MTVISWFKTPSGARSLRALLITFLVSIAAVAQTPTPIFPTLPYDFALIPEYGVATADFNGDGRIDEAFPNFNAMSIWLNNGATTSPTFVNSSLTCTPLFILAADLNNDGKSDLVFSCQQSYVGVLLGNGDGTFQTASYYEVLDPANPAAPSSLGQIALFD